MLYTQARSGQVLRVSFPSREEYPAISTPGNQTQTYINTQYEKNTYRTHGLGRGGLRSYYYN